MDSLPGSKRERFSIQTSLGRTVLLYWFEHLCVHSIAGIWIHWWGNFRTNTGDEYRTDIHRGFDRDYFTKLSHRTINVCNSGIPESESLVPGDTHNNSRSRYFQYISRCLSAQKEMEMVISNTKR